MLAQGDHPADQLRLDNLHPFPFLKAEFYRHPAGNPRLTIGQIDHAAPITFNQSRPGHQLGIILTSQLDLQADEHPRFQDLLGIGHRHLQPGLAG